MEIKINHYMNQASDAKTAGEREAEPHVGAMESSILSVSEAVLLVSSLSLSCHMHSLLGYQLTYITHT